MAKSRAQRLRRQKRQKGQQAQEAQLEESTTYSDLLATTIPANSTQSAAKVAQTLGIFQDVPYSATSPAVSAQVDCDNDAQRASQLEDTALYHAVIKANTSQVATKMAVQSKEAEANTKPAQQTKAGDEAGKSGNDDGKKSEVTSVLASANLNCAVTIWDIPKGTTEAMIVEAITAHKPLGKIYACDVYVIPGPNNIPPAMTVASVRFMLPGPATRLVIIGNDPEQGIFVKGKRAKITLSRRAQPAYPKEPASRVVIFRGPRAIVNPMALRKLWGIKEQTERLIIGKVEKGICEIEWRFCSYAYNAEPAFCVFENVYGQRKDCSVRYGVDPCA